MFNFLKRKPPVEAEPLSSDFAGCLSLEQWKSLKPCPFCGKKLNLASSESHHGCYITCVCVQSLQDTIPESIDFWNSRKF